MPLPRHRRCHAPALGDNAAWAPLIDKGFDALVRNIDGVGAMPPRGGNPSLSDLEVARAVAFMANNSAPVDEPSDDAASAMQTLAVAEALPDRAQATPDEAAAQGDTTEAAQADAGPKVTLPLQTTLCKQPMPVISLAAADS